MKQGEQHLQDTGSGFSRVSETYPLPPCLLTDDQGWGQGKDGCHVQGGATEKEHCCRSTLNTCCVPDPMLNPGGSLTQPLLWYSSGSLALQLRQVQGSEGPCPEALGQQVMGLGT